MKNINKKMSILRVFMTKYICVIAMVFASTAVSSQNATKYSNEFLQIGVGARSLAMGGSMIASADDVYAGYWNPAGLIGIKNNAQVALMHASYFAGIANYDYGAWATKTGDKGALGISLVRFGIDGIANTFDLIRNGEIDYTRVTSFNTTDFAVLLSYAQSEDFGRKAIDFSWGGNMKIISRKVGPFAKATGFGFDVGLKFANTKNNWAIGIVARDATSTFNSWRYTFTDAQKDVLAATQNAIPKNTLEITLPRILGGFAKTWEVNENWSLLAEIDANITLDGKRNTLVRTNLLSIDPYAGGEVCYNIDDKNKLYFRTGVNNFQHYTNDDGKKVPSVMPNVGLGITLSKFTIDYALTNLSAVAGNGPALYSNIFSLKLAIDRDSK